MLSTYREKATSKIDTDEKQVWLDERKGVVWGGESKREIVSDFWKKGWDPSDRRIECFDGEETMEYGTRAYQDRDNVVNVFCDDEADSGVIKLHTPYGLIDIDVSFDKSKQHIKLDISHHYGESIEVTKYDGILRVRLDASLTPEQEEEMLKGYEIQDNPMEIPGENRDTYC